MSAPAEEASKTTAGPESLRATAVLCTTLLLLAPSAAQASDPSGLVVILYGMAVLLLIGPTILVTALARRSAVLMALTWGPLSALLFAPAYTPSLHSSNYWPQTFNAVVGAAFFAAALVFLLVRLEREPRAPEAAAEKPGEAAEKSDEASGQTDETAEKLGEAGGQTGETAEKLGEITGKPAEATQTPETPGRN